MIGVISGFKRQLAAIQVRREHSLPLDIARYISVSSGRLEPYLRTLAAVKVWVSEPKITTCSDDGIVFIYVWTTKARARLGCPTARSFTAVSVPEVLTSISAGGTSGMIVDRNTATELTVEPHHFDTIAALAAGDARVEAFSAIGAEELRVCSSYKSGVDLPQADQVELEAISVLPTGFTLLRVEVELAGNPVGPQPYRIYFVQDLHQSLPPLSAQLHTELAARLGPTRVLVDPARPSWQRDLLWDMRAWACPLTPNLEK